MHIGFYIALFIAFVVLPLLSFLRNGAILRGGAVAVMCGAHKGNDDASLVALHSTKRPSFKLPQESAASAAAVQEGESTELKGSHDDSNSFALAETGSPHSQSSQVFLQARRSSQQRKRKAKLIRQRGGDAAEVEAAEREGVTAATGSDVASAWDPHQLCADDTVRLVFLFTFALPVFAFWCWELRKVRVMRVVDLYCLVTRKEREQVSSRLQSALSAAPVVLYLGTCLALFLCYAFFVYLDHRDKDVSLKRHSDTRVNRLVNWLKFRVYRRYVNFKCYLWKRYFALQLVPAYGPLPLFVFPEGEEEPFFSHESSRSKMDAGHGTASGVSNGSGGRLGGGGGDGTPSRHYATPTAGARLNPFYVAVSSSSNGEDSLLDTPLGARASPIEAPAFLAAHAPFGNSGSVSAAADLAATPGGVFDMEAPSHSRTTPSTNPIGDESDDWDEEERGLLRSRGNSGAMQPTRPPSSESLADAAATAGDAGCTMERTHSFSSADLTKALSSPPPPTPVPPPPPPMRRAHYFFAAHPHGILPWCCCVNLISNVTRRNEKLFVDNREAVLHPPPPLASLPLSSPLQPDGTADGGAAAGANRVAEEHSARTPTSTSPRPANVFTTSNTRAATPTAASALHEPVAVQAEAGDSSLPHNATVTNGYAKARYYVYNAAVKKFVLRLDKDEAVPASAADAAAYRVRLEEEEEERRRAARARATGVDASSPVSVRQRLKIRIRAVVATFPFYVPLMREIYMFHGYMDASYETCKRVLLYNNSTRREREGRANASAPPSAVRKGDGESGHPVHNRPFTKAVNEEGDSTDDGDDDDDDEGTLPDDLNHLMLFPGGASEALLSSSHGPARVLLRRRKGFLRLALHTQSGLVPVYTFGETDYFDQFTTATTRYAAPLDDDSTLFSHREASQDEAGAATTHTATATGYYRNVIHSCSDEDEEKQAAAASSSSDSTSPRLPLVRPDAAALKTAEQHRKRALEMRLLRHEEEALDREGRMPRSPAQSQPSLGVVDRARGSSLPTKAAPSTTPANVSAEKHKPHGMEKATPTSVSATSASTSASPPIGRLPRLVQAVQRIFQETFGISLPVVRNLIPHRVTGATVVGRPIYFLLPPELQRMYTDAANCYDREKERAVLLAAQEVYFNELQELFLKYAPRYLKDPSRRKLEIL